MIGTLKFFNSGTIKKKINYLFSNKDANMKTYYCKFSTKIIYNSNLDEKTLNLANSIKITEKCAEVKF